MKTPDDVMEMVTLTGRYASIEFSLIDKHFSKETKIDTYKDLTGITRVEFRTFFLNRELKDDYIFRHPANLWNLLLHFLFCKCSFLKNKLHNSGGTND